MTPLTLKRWHVTVVIAAAAFLSSLATMRGMEIAQLKLERDAYRLAAEQYAIAYVAAVNQAAVQSFQYPHLAGAVEQTIAAIKRAQLADAIARYIASVNPRAPAREIAEATLAIHERYGIPVDMLLAQQQIESAFNPKAVSETGARCLMQIVKSTAERELGVAWDEIFDIETCIDAGARYMTRHLERYGDMAAALRRYCGGCDPLYDHKVLSAAKHIGRVLGTLDDA